MKYFYVYFLRFAFLLLCWQYAVVLSIEPITIGLASGAALAISGLIGGYHSLKCQTIECCTAQWLLKNTTGLTDSFEMHLHGQHLVKAVTLRSLKAHLRPDRQPSKALVLSFHGWTGGGKNFVSKLIAEHLFVEGLKSKFVHLFIGTHHFPHDALVETYKDQLRNWVKGNVTACGRSLFIFDEIDKVPPGLLEVIIPYIEHHQDVNGVDYRNAMFLLLSNAGGERISQETLEHYSQGKRREDLTLKQMERVLVNSAYNEVQEREGGLWHSRLIEKHLIDAYVPFLPLEKEHVKLCVRDDLSRKGHRVTGDLVSRVADELEYLPEALQLFSTSGCKRVSQKVDYVLEEMEIDL